MPVRQATAGQFDASRALLLDLLRLPTATFHEEAIRAYVQGVAGTHGLTCVSDRCGNLYLTNHPDKNPQCVVAAHMDHPGLRVVAVRGRTAIIQILGGLVGKLLPHSRWKILTTMGTWVAATLTKRHQGTCFHAICDAPVMIGDWGVMDLPKPQIRAGRVSAPVLDNLAGVAAVLDWMIVHRASRTPLLGLLTCAEEVGFVGAAAVVRQQRIARDVPLVVLETSSAKVAHVALSGGPVVRVGDRMTSFHPQMDLWLQVAARRTVKNIPDFTWQRALMTGGRMESTLYGLAGYCTGALVLPLAHYHNTGARGLVPEQIAWRDWVGLRQLLDTLVTMPTVATVARQQYAALRTEIRQKLNQLKEHACAAQKKMPRKNLRGKNC